MKKIYCVPEGGVLVSDVVNKCTTNIIVVRKDRKVGMISKKKIISKDLTYNTYYYVQWNDESTPDVTYGSIEILINILSEKGYGFFYITF